MPAGINALARVTVAALAAVANRTATLTGTGLDLLTAEGVARVTLHGLRATGNLTPTLEHSDDNSSWATAPTSAFAGFTAITSGTDFLQSVQLDTRECKRYVRLVGTAASTPDHTYGASVAYFKKYE